MASIREYVDVIRSKNAGPYAITFDLIFKDEAAYRKVKEADLINKKMITKLYGIKAEDVISVIDFKPAHAIKFTIRRPLSAGAVGERDVYGAQQHAPLLTLEL